MWIWKSFLEDCNCGGGSETGSCKNEKCSCQGEMGTCSCKADVKGVKCDQCEDDFQKVNTTQFDFKCLSKNYTLVLLVYINEISVF